MTGTSELPAGASTRTPRPSGVTAAFAVEVAKLRAQRAALTVLGGCVAGPPLLVLALRLQGSPPTDTLFGRQVGVSGLAPSLFLLAFGAQWLLPLLTGLVGGDVVAAEDRHGTWKTLLTRSCSRREVFRAKALVSLAWAAMVVVLLAVSSLVAGLLLVGGGPLAGLTGQQIQTGPGIVLVLLCWATVIPPALGFAALGVLTSTLSRSTAVGAAVPVVTGLVMSLLALVPHSDVLRHLLLATPFGSWHGLLTAPTSYGPLLRGLLVCALWTGGCLALAERSLLGRDVTGG